MKFFQAMIRVVWFVAVTLGPWRSGAATLLVANTNDSGAGSLRQAIKNSFSGDTIIFSNSVTGTILLTSGELYITNNVTIVGPGANLLAINGNAASRVFEIFGAQGNATVTISGLTITNGLASGSLTIDGEGGGILCNYSTVAVSNCTFSGNTAGSFGGAIANDDSVWFDTTLTVIGCTLSGNSASVGGGIYNHASINSFGSAMVTVVASTLSSNSASAGGAIANECQKSGSVTVLGSTLSGNIATNGGYYGGGIDNFVEGTGTATLTIGDSILRAGASGSNIYNSGTVISLGFNLSSDDGDGYLTAPGDRINTEPMLGPLQDNGGPTPTMMPLPGSPAIDQGKNLSVLATEQRGRCRTYDDPTIPNAVGGDGTDIGAVEINPAHTTIVGTTNDNGVSLRWCLCDAQAGETISFGPAVTGTATLSAGELLVAKNLTVQGPGANMLAVNGNAASRVFHVIGATVGISGLTITNGNATGSASEGGGIFSDHATLTVSNCVISGNFAVNNGGGLYNDGCCAGTGMVAVAGSTISGNSAGNGGGLYNDGSGGNATLSMANSTVSGNSAGSGFGGGIYNDASGVGRAMLSVLACTIGGNMAFNDGGAIYNQASIGGAGQVLIGNTVLKAGQGPATQNIANNFGIVFSHGYNLSSDSGGFFLNATGDQINTDPLLGPLQDNGGPTPTMALLAGSPAIDKGKSFGLGTDQRGAARPFVLTSSSSFPPGGDGADIGGFELNPPVLTIARSAGNAVLSWSTLGAGFRLQAVTNLPGANNWSSVTNAPVVAGGQFYVTNPVSASQSFYRLVNP